MAINWEKIETEYITDPTSTYKSLADKYGISKDAVYRRSKAGNWISKRNESARRIYDRALTRSEAAEANKLSKLAEASERLADRILKSLEDEDQLNRHLVTVGSKGDIDTVERVYDKIDTKAIRELTQAIKTLDDLQRGWYNIQRAEHLNRERREEARLQIERERLELERKRLDSQSTDKSVEVVIRGGYDEEWGE